MKRQTSLSMRSQGSVIKMFSPKVVSSRHAGEGFKQGDLVMCILTKRVGVVLQVLADIRLSDLASMITIDVQFPVGEAESYRPSELTFLESAE